MTSIALVFITDNDKLGSILGGIHHLKDCAASHIVRLVIVVVRAIRAPKLHPSVMLTEFVLLIRVTEVIYDTALVAYTSPNIRVVSYMYL